jgi:hypothetical protein
VHNVTVILSCSPTFESWHGLEHVARIDGTATSGAWSAAALTANERKLPARSTQHLSKIGKGEIGDSNSFVSRSFIDVIRDRRSENCGVSRPATALAPVQIGGGLV